MNRPLKILIVEDEPLIVMMLEDFLDALGHQAAGNADSVARALARIETGGFDAAILDVNLTGGERSWPIADALAAAGIPFMLATGGSGDVIPPEHAARPVLPKPFSCDLLEKALAAVASPAL